MFMLGRISSYIQSEFRCSPVWCFCASQSKSLRSIEVLTQRMQMRAFSTASAAVSDAAGSHLERRVRLNLVPFLFIFHTVPFPRFLVSFLLLHLPNFLPMFQSVQNLRWACGVSGSQGRVPAVLLFPVATYAKPASSETLRAGTRESFLSRGLLSLHPFMI